MAPRILAKASPIILALTVALLGNAGGASAQSASLDGSWSGGGKVTFPSGATESARCRVSYNRASGSSYSANAACATPSGRINQSANLRRTGANTFSGDFHNPEYGITGSIVVVVSGSSQSVSLNGGGASASLRLSR
jgi:hypothetical protein